MPQRETLREEDRTIIDSSLEWANSSADMAFETLNYTLENAFGFAYTVANTAYNVSFGAASGMLDFIEDAIDAITTRNPKESR